MAASETPFTKYVRLLAERSPEAAAKRARRAIYRQTPAAAAFQRFYDENKDRLAPTQSHAVDVDALNAWQASLGQREATREFEQLFGRVVARGIQYISFAEFLESLRRTSYEARDISLRDDLPIVLYVPLFRRPEDTVFWRKSNFWTSLLIWPFIADRVADVVDSDTLAEYTNLGANRRPFLILMADDGAFSGDQMSQLLPSLANVGERDVVMLVLGALSNVAREKFHKTWRDVALLQRGRDTRGTALRRRDLVLPSQPIYLSTVADVARATLAPAEYVVFMRAMRREHPMLRNVDSDVTLAYFDHKLPDDVSTLTDLFAFAPIEASGRVTLRSLITNCTPAAYGARETYESLDAVPEVGDNNDCPPAVYKSIRYTNAGRDVRGANLKAIMPPAE